MHFLPPNQQRQSTEGKNRVVQRNTDTTVYVVMSTVQVKWISKLPLICVCLFLVKTSVQTLITVQSQESLLVSPQCNFTGKIHREELVLSQEHSDNESTQFYSSYNFQLFNQPFSGFPGWTNTEQNLWGQVTQVFTGQISFLLPNEVSKH